MKRLHMLKAVAFLHLSLYAPCLSDPLKPCESSLRNLRLAGQSIPTTPPLKSLQVMSLDMVVEADLYETDSPASGHYELVLLVQSCSKKPIFMIGENTASAFDLNLSDQSGVPIDLTTHEKEARSNKNVWCYGKVFRIEPGEVWAFAVNFKDSFQMPDKVANGLNITGMIEYAWSPDKTLNLPPVRLQNLPFRMEYLAPDREMQVAGGRVMSHEEITLLMASRGDSEAQVKLNGPSGNTHLLDKLQDITRWPSTSTEVKQAALEMIKNTPGYCDYFRNQIINDKSGGADFAVFEAFRVLAEVKTDESIRTVAEFLFDNSNPTAKGDFDVPAPGANREIAMLVLSRANIDGAPSGAINDKNVSVRLNEWREWWRKTHPK